MNFFDKIVGEHGFLVELRTKNSFNEQLYTDIMNYLSENVSRWKSNGAIPIADAVPIFHLIDELSGGSRFWSEEVQLRVEDAMLELQDFICTFEEGFTVNASFYVFPSFKFSVILNLVKDNLYTFVYNYFQTLKGNNYYGKREKRYFTDRLYA